MRVHRRIIHVALTSALLAGSFIALTAPAAQASVNFDFRLGSVSVTEGNGPTNASVTVPFTTSLAPGVTLCIFYAPQNGSAVGGKANVHDGSVDFAAGTSVTKLKAGLTTGGLDTTVVYDTTSESTESYGVRITGVTVYNGTSCTTSTNPAAFSESQGDGRVNIVDDDAASEPLSLRIGDVSTSEGNGPNNVSVHVPLRFSSGVPSTVCVAFTTVDGTAVGTTKMTVHDGSADYRAMAGSVKVTAGKANATINSTVLYDTVGEPTQSYSILVTGVTLFDGSSCKTSAAGAGVTIVGGSGTVTVLDDDNPTVPDPPTNVTATCVDCSGSTFVINVAWTPPANNGGSDVNAYDLYRSIDGGASFQFLVQVGGSTTTYQDVCNLNWRCVWQTDAHNAVGYSQPSAPSNEIDNTNDGGSGSGNV